jgi:hypothetical protein
MGVLSFAETDAQAMLDDDNRVADAFDAKKRVAEVVRSDAAD